MKSNLRFGLVLDRPALLKISAILLKYPTLEDDFFRIFMDKTNAKFLHIIAINLHKNEKTGIFCFKVYSFVSR